jgi:hypothetical protein
MEADANVRAYDAVTQSPRAGDLGELARAVLLEMTQGPKSALPDAERVRRRARELKLDREETVTPFGNALDVLERGPEDDAERALARAIAAHGLLATAPGDAEQLADTLLWLAARTPFDATPLIDHAGGPDAIAVWRAIAKRLSQSTTSPPSVAVPMLRGELASTPRGPVLTTLLALTGVRAAMHAARLLGRVAFGYRRPAEVSVGGDGGVRVRWRTELLGRTLGDRDVVLPRASLTRATREVRYPRLLLYVGLLGLCVGSYLGVTAFVDGVRAASPSLLGSGLAIVCVSLALDFALSSVAPSAGGRCRLFLSSRDGRTLCVQDVETSLADAFLGRLSKR